MKVKRSPRPGRCAPRDGDEDLGGGGGGSGFRGQVPRRPRPPAPLGSCRIAAEQLPPPPPLPRLRPPGPGRPRGRAEGASAALPAPQMVLVKGLPSGGSGLGAPFPGSRAGPGAGGAGRRRLAAGCCRPAAGERRCPAEPAPSAARRRRAAPLGKGGWWWWWWLRFPGVSQRPRRGGGQRPRCRGKPWPGADPGPALPLRTAGSGARSGFPAEAFRLFAGAALNFLSKVLIRRTVLCSCFVRANESAGLERLVTQGIVIRSCSTPPPALFGWAVPATCDFAFSETTASVSLGGTRRQEGSITIWALSGYNGTLG